MTIEYKVCSSCGESKRLSPEFFKRRKDSKDGFLNFCKMCDTKGKRETVRSSLLPKLLSSGYKAIPDHRQYIVGEDAKVYDVEGMRYVNTYVDSKGYYTCSLADKQGHSRGVNLHRIMYETFLKGAEYFRPIVCFKDGDKLNCSLNNLYVSEHPLIARSTLNKDFSSKIRARAHSVHHTLMRRINNGYGTVCEDWKDFETFHSWYAQHSIPQWHMEKDILVDGNKHYCPDTVCFVPRKLNNFFSHLLPPKLKYVSKKGRTSRNGRDFFPCIDLALGGVKYRLTGGG